MTARLHPLAGLCAVVLAAVIALLALGQTDLVSTAPGVVRPFGEHYPVQSPQSGRVAEWRVVPHAEVTEGALLARLDTRELDRRADAVAERLAVLGADQRRLESLLSEFAVDGSPDAAARSVLDARHAAERRLELQSQREAAAKLAAAAEEVRLALARLDGAIARRDWQQRHCMASRRLQAQGGLAAADWWQVERECAAAEASVDEALRAHSLAHRAVQVARASELRRQGELVWRLRERLAETAQELAERRAEWDGLQQQRRDAFIRAPVAGQVESLRLEHSGAVVQAGEVLCVLVPTSAEPVIQALLADADRHGIHTGQRVEIKVAALPWTRHGSLPGVVEAIAAETSTVAEGPTGYPVQVRPQAHPLLAALRPGMQVTVDFHRSREALWSWLMRPIITTLKESAREP
jgi:hemolysin D